MTGQDKIVNVMQEIRDYEANCNGFDEHYKHWMTRVTYSSGVKFVAEVAGAYWLIDAIMSYQTAKVRAACDGFQHWILAKNKTTNGAILYCTDGNSDKAIVRQRFTSISIPLAAEEELHFYIENDVLFLRAER